MVLHVGREGLAGKAQEDLGTVLNVQTGEVERGRGLGKSEVAGAGGDQDVASEGGWKDLLEQRGVLEIVED